MLYDLRTTFARREHVGLARRQQADARRRKAHLNVVRPVQFPRIKVELERQLRLVDHIREGVQCYANGTYLLILRELLSLSLKLDNHCNHGRRKT